MAVIDNALMRDAAVTAAGTTQADAAAVKVKHALVTSIVAGAGVVLQELFCSVHAEGSVHNGVAAAGAAETGQALLIYPWSGAAFNGQAVNLPLTLPAGSGCRWVYFSPTKIGITY